MKTYVIIDQLGAKHGTVKAATATDAMNVFCGNSSQSFRDMIFAIELSTMELFISNLKNIWTMRYIEIFNIERSLFNPTNIEFVGRCSRMFVAERLFIRKIGNNMNDRFILFFEELQYME